MSRFLLILIVTSLITRFLFFIFLAPWQSEVENAIILHSDALGYHKIATTILQFHHFAVNRYEPSSLHHVPIYPLFLSIIYYVFGVHPWIVLVIQIFLSTGACILFYFTLRTLVPENAAKYAALFFAVNPFLIMFSNALLTDVLFGCVLVVLMYFSTKILINNINKEHISHIIFSAIFCGAAALLRPIAVYLPILVLAFLLYKFKSQFVHALGYSLMFIVVFLFTISPWLIRNYRISGSLVFSTSGAYNLLVLNVTPFEMNKRKLPADTVKAQLLKEADSLMIVNRLNPYTENDYQKSIYWQQVAYHYISENKSTFIKYYCLGMVQTFTNLASATAAEMLQLSSPDEHLDIKAHPNVFEMILLGLKQKSGGEIFIGVVIALYLLFTYLCLFTGLYVLKFNDNRLLFLFYLSIIFYFVILTGAGGLARFSLPAIPFYLVFCGVGLSHWITKFRQRK
ncbi:MAG: ArnT family glycosyltransferase [Bacteroidota bacterium]